METKKVKRLDQLSQAAQDEGFSRMIAIKELAGSPANEIAKELAITAGAVKKIQSSDRYKELIIEISQDNLVDIITKMKRDLTGLGPLAVKTMKKAMEVFIETGSGGRDAITASQSVLKAHGLHQEGDKQQDTTINVVLPAGLEPVTFEVKNDD